MKKLFALCAIVILILSGLIGKVNADENVITENYIETNKIELVTNYVDDEIDQYQDKSRDGKQFYDNIWLAQSFTPDMDLLTRVQVYINYTHVSKSKTKEKTFENRPFLDLVSKIQNRISNIAKTLQEKIERFTDKKEKDISVLVDEVEDMILSIRKDLDGPDLATKNLVGFPQEDVKTWKEFVLDEPLNVNAGETYYIVIRAQEGDQKDYYNWHYFDSYDVYKSGIGYISNNYGSSWSNLGNNFDFAFKTYGAYETEEGDGTVDRWAVITGKNGGDVIYNDDSAELLYDRLISKGWNANNIVILKNEEVTNDNVKNAIKWMDEMDDGDDISVYYGCAHSGTPGVASSNLKYLDILGSQGIGIFIDCCYSGRLIDDLGKPGRVILTSAKSDEQSWEYMKLKKSVFTYYLAESLGASTADENNDDWVSAEEAYDYLYPKVVDYPISQDIVQHPQIYDGYEGELKITNIG